MESSWLKSPGLKSLGLKGLGLKIGVEKSGVEMSFNLPSLMAADKPCPLLQPSLTVEFSKFGTVFELFLSIVQSSAGKPPWWEIPQNWSIFFGSGGCAVLCAQCSSLDFRM